MTVHGFWGLKVLPGIQYTQKVTLPFMITMASLTDTITSNKRCSLLLNVDGEEFVMCSLTPEKLEQQVLNTTLMEGEEVTFSIRGDNAIHLTGNHVFDIADGENEDQHSEHIDNRQKHATASLDSDLASETNNNNNRQQRKRLAETDPQERAKRSKDDNDLISSNHHHSSTCKEEQQKLQSYMDSLNGHVQQLEQQLSLFSNLQQQQSHHNTLKSSKEDSDQGKEKDNNKKKLDDKKKQVDDKKKQVDDKKNQVDDKKKLDNKKKLEGKKERTGIKKSVSTSTTASVSTSTSALESTSTSAAKKQKSTKEEKSTTKLKVVRLPNGMVVEDKKLGEGRPVGSGGKVGLRYMGKLLNGKKFDSNTSGPPFRFTLGKGEVIRGWDIGVAGMKVGGERKLIIPPSLAYRQRGMPPDIPPNSTLVFDVKLVELK